MLDIASSDDLLPSTRHDNRR